MARYDDLEADQVLEHLGGLSQQALTKLGEYERGHRNRPEVLDGIAALTGEEPWPGYDEQSVPALADDFQAATRERLNTVIAYERAHKNRSEVLQAATHRLVMSDAG
jgi:hypothetical protein